MSDTPHPLIPRLACRANEVIFSQGEAGQRAYIVERGEVAIVRTEGGRRRVLGTIAPGGMFGEMALVDGEPRMADAVAVRDTTCFVINRDVFLSKFEAADPFLKAMVRFFVRNIRSTSGVDRP